MATNVEEFNKDELQAPEWLDNEFFLKVLSHCENDSQLKVVTFKITPGTAKGDHYASIMFRVVINYLLRNEKKTKSLIIKLMPEVEGHKKEMLRETFIFETEIAMYTEMIPKLEKILQDVGDNTKLSAPCLYYALSPKKLIVFEDLVPLGYTVIRDRYIDMEEAKGAFLKLAKIHAVSHKLAAENPSFFAKYRHGFMSTPGITKDRFVTQGIKAFIIALDDIPTLVKYKPYFEALQPQLIEKCIQSFKEYFDSPQANAYYVLCHGDFHTKNMMFKKNPANDKFEDVLFLDYQMSFLGPVALDLLYANYFLLSPEQRKNHSDELIYYYFSNFIETLKKIGFNRTLPNMIEFREQMTRHRHFAIFALVSILPMLYAIIEDGLSPDELLQDTSDRSRFCKNKSYIAELEWLLPKFLHLGYLD